MKKLVYGMVCVVVVVFAGCVWMDNPYTESVVDIDDHAYPSDLVFYCSFNSEREVAVPEVGKCTGVMGAGQIVKGKFGKAYYLEKKRIGAKFDFPSGVITNKGCVEAWVRLDEANRGLAYSNGSPEFFSINPQGSFSVFINFGWINNNGLGKGGLATAMPGFTLATSSFGRSDYAKYLGTDIGGWHHYALVWNAEGVSSFKTTGEGVIAAIFIDGKVVAKLPLAGRENWRLSDYIAANTMMFIGAGSNRSTTNNERSFTIDELKIWNTDKASFGL